LKPEDAYVEMFRSGALQETMPFETTQYILIRELPTGKRVNAALYPSSPRGVMGHYLVEFEGETLVVNESHPTGSGRVFDLDHDSNVYTEIRVDGRKLLVDSGFYGSEEQFVWSRRKSCLLLENRGREEHLVVERAFRPQTTISIKTWERSFRGKAPIEFSVRAKTTRSKWIRVCFDASDSGIPSQHSKESRDDRDLSFQLSFD
jgi:hypothetical protein